MEIELRQEKIEDYRAVEELTREAFWNHFGPGCFEHYLVHVMRDSQAFVKELDIVALHNDKIVGNIMYTKAFVLGDDGTKREVLCFGPLAVLPEFQGRGVGRKLIEYTKAKAKELGYKAILITGDPEYYKRAGFVPAENFSIGTSWDTYAAALLACELEAGALDGCSGRFFEDEIYNIDQRPAEEFDKAFPPKEKITGLPTQARFNQLVTMNRTRI